VSLSVLVSHLDPARLRTLYAIAFCTGLAALFAGFRRSRARPTESANSVPSKPDSNPHTPPPSAPVDSADSTPQVIRLSVPPVGARSVEMSQQEKVAAALIRAGLSNPTSWTDASPQVGDNSPAAKSDSASGCHGPSIVPLTHYIKPLQPKQNSSTPGIGPKLLLIGGSLLALISLYLFLRIR
jgi:hypothetical protein